MLKTNLSSYPAYTNYSVGESINKTENGLTLNSEYYKRYYSMIDAEIYFGDTYIEEIHDITWNFKQQQAPIYGYNSYLFDEVALGNRLITGTFTVNFTGANVFNKIIENASIVKNINTSVAVSGTVDTVSSTTTTKNTITETSDKEPIWNKLFDIDIMCTGNISDGSASHIILRNANISTCVGELAAIGGVFQQKYSFIAQDFTLVN